MKKFKRFLKYLQFWLLQVLIALDQLINALLPIRDGWADETLSARCWRKSQQENPLIGWCIARFVVDLVFFAEPKHCKIAYEREQQRMHSPPALRVAVSNE